MGRLVASLLFVSCVITRSMGHGDHVFNPTTEGDDSSPQSSPDFWTFQGDIMVSEEQRNFLDPGDSKGVPSPSRAYAAPKDLKQLWFNGRIPYEFDCSLKNMPDLIRIVHKAMREWEKHTCVRFVKREAEEDYVRFFRGSHCYSSVGRPDGKKQVSVGNGCEFHHVMLHELGHVIGFWHEQSRPDRDEHVRIIWSNVKSGWEYAFLKLNWKAVDSMNIPYDYGSIMHYPYNAFSKSFRKRTIIPLRPNIDKPYKKLSHFDILQANMMYRCPNERQTNNNERQTGNKEQEVEVFGRRLRRDLDSKQQRRTRSRRRAYNKTERNKDEAKDTCADRIVACDTWAKQGFCKTRPDVMLVQCMTSCKVPCKTKKSHERRQASTNVVVVVKTNNKEKQNKNTVEINKRNQTKRPSRPRRKWKRCHDKLKSCQIWAKMGFCKSRPDIMFVKCKKSCDRCPLNLRKMCVDEDPRCKTYHKWGYCSHPYYRNIEGACRLSCGVCKPESCRDRERYRCRSLKIQGHCTSKVPRTYKVMKMLCTKTCNLCFNKGVYYKPLPPLKDLPCRDLYKACFGWSRLGYCENKQNFMNTYCRKSCDLCTVRTSRHIKLRACVDNDVSCDVWAKKDYCRIKAKYMAQNCRRTCKLCTEQAPKPEPPCVDKHKKCARWAKRGRCHSASLYMMKMCKKSCKICESNDQGQEAVEVDIKQCYDKMRSCVLWSKLDYCSRIRWMNFMYRYCPLSCKACSPGQGDGGDSRPLCKDKDEINCRHWASLGKCRARPEFMMEKCQKTCNACPKSPPGMIPEKPVGIRCSKRCKEFLKKGRCTSRFRRSWCLRSCLAKGCDDEPIRLIGRCGRALGAGWNESLPDSAFKASSVLSHAKSKSGSSWDFGAHNARLYKEDDANMKRVGAWCASKLKNQWLQVDLGKVKTVTAVATQGRDKFFEHVKTYELSFSVDGIRWIKYRERGKTRILRGNCDHFTPVVNRLQRNIHTRFIRFHPLTFNNLCMRVEIYGCDGRV